MLHIFTLSLLFAIDPQPVPADPLVALIHQEEQATAEYASLAANAQETHGRLAALAKQQEIDRKKFQQDQQAALKLAGSADAIAVEAKQHAYDALMEIRKKQDSILNPQPTPAPCPPPTASPLSIPPPPVKTPPVPSLQSLKDGPSEVGEKAKPAKSPPTAAIYCCTASWCQWCPAQHEILDRFATVGWSVTYVSCEVMPCTVVIDGKQHHISLLPTTIIVSSDKPRIIHEALTAQSVLEAELSGYASK